MSKNLIYLGGVLIGLMVFIVIGFEKISLVSDKINIASIIINIVIAILAVTYFQNKEGNSRALKNYFINEVSTLKTDYGNFIEGIKSNNIKKGFKNFSIRNGQLELFLRNEMKLEDTYIQKKNREIMKLITDSYEFNNIYGDSELSISNEDNNSLIKLHKEFNHHLTSIIIQINKT